MQDTTLTPTMKNETLILTLNENVSLNEVRSELNNFSVRSVIIMDRYGTSYRVCSHPLPDKVGARKLRADLDRTEQKFTEAFKNFTVVPGYKREVIGRMDP